MQYALIRNNSIVNIVNSDEEFVQSLISQNMIDEGVVIESEDPKPQVGWQYVGSVFSDPLMTVPIVKAQKMADLKTAIEAYIEERYSTLTRTQFLNLYTLSKFDRLAARAAYIRTGLNWFQSVANYATVAGAQIQALNTVNALVAYQWDIAPNVIADPLIKIGTALAISESAQVIAATATGDTTTTSATDVLLDSMTLTPAAGTYFVVGSTSVESTSNGGSVTLSIYANGVQAPGSERPAIPFIKGVLLGNETTIETLCTQATVTVNGSQAIELRWRRSAGTATAHQRSMNLIQVA